MNTASAGLIESIDTHLESPKPRWKNGNHVCDTIWSNSVSKSFSPSSKNWFFFVTMKYKKNPPWPLNLNTCTNLLQPLEVLPEEGHGPVWPRGAQLHNAVLQQLLNVVFLHVLLTLPQAPLLLAARTSRCHGDNRNPALWPLTFALGKADRSVEKTGSMVSDHLGATWIHVFRAESSTKKKKTGCLCVVMRYGWTENVRMWEKQNQSENVPRGGVLLWHCGAWVLLSVRSKIWSYDEITHRQTT